MTRKDYIALAAALKAQQPAVMVEPVLLGGLSDRATGGSGGRPDSVLT